MKKIFIALTTIILSFSFIIPTFAEEQESSVPNTEEIQIRQRLFNLSQDEINERFHQIDQNYPIGEAFDLEDQIFIEMYATDVTKPVRTPYVTQNIWASRTVNGITASVSGSVKHGINGIIKQNFGGNVNTNITAGSSKVTSVRTYIYHCAYGLVGSGGIGKVYSGNLNTSGKSTNLNGTKEYTAIVAYASTWCEVVVNHKGGMFTLNPGGI